MLLNIILLRHKQKVGVCLSFAIQLSFKIYVASKYKGGSTGQSHWVLDCVPVLYKIYF